MSVSNKPQWGFISNSTGMASIWLDPDGNLTIFSKLSTLLISKDADFLDDDPS